MRVAETETSRQGPRKRDGASIPCPAVVRRSRGAAESSVVALDRLMAGEGEEEGGEVPAPDQQYCQVQKSHLGRYRKGALGP